MFNNTIRKIIAFVLISVIFLSEISYANEVNTVNVNEVENSNQIQSSIENEENEYSQDEQNNEETSIDVIEKKDEEVNVEDSSESDSVEIVPEDVNEESDEANEEEKNGENAEEIIGEEEKKSSSNLEVKKENDEVRAMTFSTKSTMSAVQTQTVTSNVLEDGLYEIEVGVNSNCVIDVINSAKYGGANVQISKRNNAVSQKVEIIHIGNGYYTIKFRHSNMFLDVYYGKTANGTNVWQCGGNGSDAQKWLIKDAGNGYYNIISKCGDKYLTVHNGSSSIGTNIEIYNKKSTSDKSQMFKIKKVETIVGTKTIEDGIYEIEIAGDSRKVLDVKGCSYLSGANVQIYSKNGEDCQRVRAKYVGEGYYTFEFIHSGKYLDVANANIIDGTNVWQCNGNGSGAQKWIVKDAGNGYYNIISKCSGTFLTVCGGATANSTNVEINSKKDNASQKFKFNKIEAIVGSQTIADGIYEIETKVNSNKVIEVINGSKVGGANVQINDRNNALNQRANVKYIGDGYYTIQFKHSGMFLDVYYGKAANGTNVWQCGGNGADAQKWVIKDVGNGYYNIISKCGDKYLTVHNGAATNGTNVEIYAPKDNNSQLFKFKKIEPVVGTQTIEDGIYEIEIAGNSSKVLDVKSASTLSGANVQILTRNGEQNQRVQVKYDVSGYYTIEFKHSGRNLDVANAQTINGTNVWQCTKNGADAQKWVIKDAGNGYYNIISKCSGTYLTVSGGGTTDGTNIEINTYKNNNSQKFRFKKIEPIVGTQTIADGIYEIETKVNSNKVIEVINGSKVGGANVQINDRNNALNQRANVKYIGDGYYTIQFKHSGMFLDVYYAKTANGTNVWQCGGNGADAQKWVIKDVGNGYYNIISKCGDKYLTVHNGAATNGTNVEIYAPKDNNSQLFKFKKIEPVVGTQTIEDGTYVIESALSSSKVLDVAKAGTNSGANVQLYDKNKSLCQKVEVKYDGGGYYTIEFKHSGRNLDVANAQTINGTNVWQCTKNGADAQKWIIKDAGNGYYNIISKCSNTYLTVEGGKTANGTNVQIYSSKNDNSQKFRFTTPESPTGTQTIADGTYEIETAISDSKVIEVADGLQNGGANVQIYTRNMAKCQKVEVKYEGDGYYSIKFAHSGKYLDVSNGGKADGTNVWQCAENGSDAQRWIIKDVGNGYFNIISKCTETYLTVAGGKNADKTNIEVNRFVNNNSQKFKFKTPKNVIGIDVSSHQGDIDWNKVKASDVDFVIIRCGFGQDMTSQDDAKFARNISECERLKIPYGVYIYSYALNEASAVSEAEHVVRLIKGHNPTMGIWFDMEDADGYKVRNGMPSDDMLVRICLKFCQTMKSKGYNNVGIYASLSWFNNQLNDSRLDVYDKWVAQWNSVCTYKKKYAMWQYTDNGTVTGISGYVDMNKCVF